MTDQTVSPRLAATWTPEEKQHRRVKVQDTPFHDTAWSRGLTTIIIIFFSGYEEHNNGWPTSPGAAGRGPRTHCRPKQHYNQATI